MESLSNFSFEIIKWLQSNYPQLEPFFLFVSELGRFEVYLATIPLFYWCINKGFGKALAYLLILSELLNTTFKQALRDPRPYWIDPSIGLATAEDYGMPSGHTQTITVLSLFVSAWIGAPWIWLIAFFLILLTSLSRIYLGLHDIPDVIAGIGLGILIFSWYLIWRKYLAKRFYNRILGQRLLIALIVPVTFALFYMIIRFIIGEPDYQVVWSQYIDLAETTALENTTRAFAGLLGLTIGFILESSRIRFMVHGPIWKRVLRYLIGISITAVLAFGLVSLIPNEPLWLSMPVKIIAYLIGGLWVAYYSPMLFVRLRLAESRPEPEISLTL